MGMSESGTTAAASSSQLDATEVAPASPYVGLTAFTENDAAIFFGRDAERKVLISNLRASRLTLLYARSGTGKSSLLRAGVEARLRQLAQQSRAERGTVGNVPVIVSSWHDDPTDGLIDAVEAALADALPDRGPISLPRTGLAAALEAGAAFADAALLIILDQFEEYVLARRVEAREGRFADELAACLNRPDLRANVLLAIREDVYSGLGDLFKSRIQNVYGNYLHLSDLDIAAAREAITHPIERVNELHPDRPPIEIEPALVQAVLEQLSRSEEVALDRTEGGVVVHTGSSNGSGEIAAPYLQLVMKRIWDEEVERRTSDDDPVRLRLETLAELGGAEMIVTTHVDRVLAGLSTTDRDAAVDVFRHLVTRSGTKIALASSDLADYTGRSEIEVQDLLERLTRPDVRILHDVPPSAGTQSPRFEISHDLLAPPILDWSSRVLQRREAWRRRRRVLIGGGAVAALVAVLAALSTWALIEQGNAKDARNHAEWVAVGSTAKDLAASRLGDSLVLGLAAYQNDPTPAVRSAVTSALEQAEASGARTILIGHTGAVLTIDDSSDGLVVSGGQDGTVRLWDAARGREIGGPMTGRGGAVRAVAFSPDGQTIAGGGDGRTLRFWSTESQKPLSRPIELATGPVGIAFSPDGALLAVASQAGHVYVIDPRAPSRPHVLLTGNDSDLTAVAFSPDGRNLVAASQGGRIFVWPASKVDANPAPRPTSYPVVHDKAVLAIAFDPRGHLLAMGGGDNTVRIWDTRTSAEVWEQRAPAVVTDVAFSPDGSELATTEGDGPLKIWDAQTGRLQTTYSGHFGHASGVVFSPDGRTLTTSGFDGTLRVWDRGHHSTLGRVVSYDRPEDVNGVAYAPDGMLATVDERSNLRLWRPFAPRPQWELKVGPDDELHGVARSPTGEIATAGDDGYVGLWDKDAGARLAMLKAGEDAVHTVAFSPDGGLVAGGTDDGKVRVWRTATNKPVGTRQLPGVGINGVAFAPLGHVLATACTDGRVRLLALPSLKVIRRSSLSAARMGIAFSPDGETIAAAGADGTIRLLDAQTLKQQGEALVGHAGPVFAVAFSPSGHTLVSASVDGTLRLWDPASHVELGDPLTGHDGRVNAVAFSPDGATLASSGADGTVRTWSGFLWRNPTDLAKRVCQRVSSGLTSAEWGSVVPGTTYPGPVCGHLAGTSP
jgi:WD40 repeat protein